MEDNKMTSTEDFKAELKRCNFFSTLKPSQKQETYNASVAFDSYSDLMFTVRDLLKISVHTLQNNGTENSGQIKNPAGHLIGVLEVAIQLMPCSEGEGLDKLHQLYLELQCRKDQENTKNQL